MADQPITISQEFGVSIEKLWSAITDKDQMVKWFFEEITEFKPEVDFETNFNIHHNGNDYIHEWKVLEVHAYHKLVYSWKYRGYPGDSYVVWELTAARDKTMLHFFHYGQDSFPQDMPDFSRESCTLGWTYFINHRLNEFLNSN